MLGQPRCPGYAAILKAHDGKRPDNYEGALETFLKEKQAALGIRSMIDPDNTEDETFSSDEEQMSCMVWKMPRKSAQAQYSHTKVPKFEHENRLTPAECSQAHEAPVADENMQIILDLLLAHLSPRSGTQSTSLLYTYDEKQKPIGKRSSFA